MRSRGFVRLAGGTNRLVYRHLEYTPIVVKVAMDREGIKNNPDEFRTQHYIKPFCAKPFEVSPCGTVGLFEGWNELRLGMSLRQLPKMCTI